MKCPKCGRDMKAGFLQASAKSGIVWTDEIMPLMMSWFKTSSVCIPCDERYGAAAVRTYICKQCKLFVGDYGDTD